MPSRRVGKSGSVGLLGLRNCLRHCGAGVSACWDLGI